MSKSSNSASIIVGSLAVAGAVAAASLWSSSRHESKDCDENEGLPKSLAFFKNFYLVKGDRSVSTERTEDSSVVSSEESLEVTEEEEKIINYDWDDEEYVEEKPVEQTPVSGSDAAAMLLATTLVAAQLLV